MRSFLIWKVAWATWHSYATWWTELEVRGWTMAVGGLLKGRGDLFLMGKMRPSINTAIVGGTETITVVLPNS